MKLKIHELAEGPMVLTGSKVLELIQDNHTPHIDLLVRESIQNSADASLNDKDFVKIQFLTGGFDKFKFANSFETIDNNLIKNTCDENSNFLAIKDSNTTGLLGKPIKSSNGDPNNLYSLVYDIMNRKKGLLSGGSHGIGKTIYYRYGIGICIYYSRTFEEGKYVEKLAAALIQDETKTNCLLGKNTSGIAYFGDKTSEYEYCPIYNEKEIREFLDIFGLTPFSDLETGTMVIIPFVNKNLLLSNIINDDNDACYWLNNFEDALDITIQRWYFPRINNASFNGKYLKIAINNKKVELNEFFSTMQELYKGTYAGCKTLDVEGSKLAGVKLGKFNFKVFEKNELGMNPPTNLPSPKYMTDSPYEVDEKGLLFYVRKPGMVVNYENGKFGNYAVGEDKYLIGIFVLNDNAEYMGENIGGYLRQSEEANHKEWNDINSDNFVCLKSKKPFKQICSAITKKLTDEFKQTKAISLDGANTVLQKKLGEKLLPPSGYGKSPEVTGENGSGTSRNSRESKSKVEFSGMNSDNTLSYSIKLILKPNETSFIELNVKAGGKSYSFNQWEEMNFNIPCQLSRIDIEEIFIDKNKINSPQNLPIDSDFARRRKKTVDGVDLYKIRGIVTDSTNPYGFGINNCCAKKLTVNIKIAIKPIDSKYMIGINVATNGGSL